MSELNREQIIKVLECCTTNGDCPKCLYNDDTSLCINRILKDALALIKELTEENAELHREYDSMAKTVNAASDLIRNLKSHIRRLKAYDEQRDIALHARLIKETKANTVREMHEHLIKLWENNFSQNDGTVRLYTSVLERLLTQSEKEILEGLNDQRPN